MKALAVAVGIVIVWLSTGARTQTEPWCAYFTGGPTDCGFTTFEQCLAAIRGKTGLCNRNSQYVAPVAPQPSRVHRKPPRSGAQTVTPSPTTAPAR